MKKLWKKVVKCFAWIGAALVSIFAVVGAALLVVKRRKASAPSEESLERSLAENASLEKAKLESQELKHALDVEKAKNQASKKARALERDPAALADALTRLSDD